MQIKQITLSLALALITAGCSSTGPSAVPPAIPARSETSTALPIPTETLTPVPSETPSITPSSTPFAPFTVSVWADNVNVRTNPGYLFPSLGLLSKGTTLTLLGKAPGGEWMAVRTPKGQRGWVFAQLIQSDVDLQSVPVIEPQDVQLIKGRVQDSAGTPIQGVGFAVAQGGGDRPQTNTVLTDANGEFYSFMPLTARGSWTVTYNAIACKSNVWADNSCSTYKDSYRGMVEPQSMRVTLPPSGTLEFLWK